MACTFDGEDNEYEFERETQGDNDVGYNADDDEDWLHDKTVDDEVRDDDQPIGDGAQKGVNKSNEYQRSEENIA